MATLPCPHPSPLSVAQDWYRPKPVETRGVRGYEIKKAIHYHHVKRSYAAKILAARRRKIYVEAIALFAPGRDVPATALPNPDVRQRFYALADKWSRETMHISSASDLINDRNYQEIIGLGWNVVPYLLIDLKQNKRFWFPALAAITGVRPFDPSDTNSPRRMTEAWVRWGQRKGLI